MEDDVRTIANIADYLRWIKDIQDCNNDRIFPLKILYFRGHANDAWKLQCALHRDKANEFESISIATKRTWSLLPNHTSSLEKLITFQHHGLHTRLLDVTTNPLVSLYFACLNESDNVDGVVYYGLGNKEEDNRISSVIADIVTNEPCFDVVSHDHIDAWNTRYCHNQFRLSLEQLTIPNFVAPPITTQRIANQQGAFLMTPLLYNVDNTYKYCTDYVFETKGDNAMFESSKAHIPYKFKDTILEELKLLGINQSTIYPDIDNTMAYINYELKNKISLDI